MPWPPVADKVVGAALADGVLIATSAEQASVFIAPPLIVSDEELEKILCALDHGLSVADGELHKVVEVTPGS